MTVDENNFFHFQFVCMIMDFLVNYGSQILCNSRNFSLGESSLSVL